MSVTFPALLHFSDVGLLLLRLMVAVVFFDSGWNHLKNPAELSDRRTGRVGLWVGKTPAATSLTSKSFRKSSLGWPPTRTAY